MHWTVLAPTCLFSVVAEALFTRHGRRQSIFIAANLEEAYTYSQPWFDGSRSNTSSPANQGMPLNLPKPPANWEAPDYKKAFEDYENALADIQNSFTPAHGRYVDQTKINFIAIMFAIGVLSKQVSFNGWRYLNNYAAKISGLGARNHPEIAIATLNCYLSAAHEKTKRMRLLINNKWVKYVCVAKKTACNPSVFVITKMENLDEEAELLLLLGKASSMYITYFAADIHKFSQTDKHAVTNYIEAMKDKVKPLVGVYAALHNRMFGGLDYCVDKRNGTDNSYGIFLTKFKKPGV